MERITGRRRGVLAAVTLLAALALAACESAEDQEIRRLIEEIAELQEQTLAVLEATAEEEIAQLREIGAGVAGAERQSERRLQTTREHHQETLTKLRAALASGDWEIAYAEEMALMYASPLALVAGMRDLAEEEVRWAEEQRAAPSVMEAMGLVERPER